MANQTQPEIQIIDTEKSPCAWLSKYDRDQHNAANLSLWAPEQLRQMNEIIPLFRSAFGEQFTVVNINKKCFMLKVYTMKGANEKLVEKFKNELIARFRKPYQLKMNKRNEMWYSVYPN